MCRENQLCIPGICHSGIEQPDDATGQQRVHFRVELVDIQPFAMIQRVDCRISQREVFDRTLRLVYAERESDRLRGVALLVILLV